MNIRERFEEIWSVPECVYWSPVFGAYICADGSPRKLQCMEMNIRLDTFTRCQETTDVYVSLIDELVADIRYRAYHEADDEDDEKSKGLLYRVNQIMEQKK